MRFSVMAPTSAALAPIGVLLGRVDGFDQDEGAGEGDEGAVMLRRLLAA
jgi:hypothetical protein